MMLYKLIRRDLVPLGSVFPQHQEEIHQVITTASIKSINVSFIDLLLENHDQIAEFSGQKQKTAN